MAGQCRTRFDAEAGNHVQCAIGKASLPGQIGEHQRGQAGILGGFQNAGIAHGKGCADRSADDLHRIIPRHDMPRHAMRFAQGIDGVAVEIRDGLAMYLVRRAAVEFAVARKGDCIGAGLGDGFADVEGFKCRQQVSMVQHKLAEAGEATASLQRAHLAPRAVQSGLGGADSSVHIRVSAAGDPAQRAAIGGVDERQRVGRGAPCATDQDVTGVKGQGGEHLGPPGIRASGGRPPSGSGCTGAGARRRWPLWAGPPRSLPRASP